MITAEYLLGAPDTEAYIKNHCERGKENLQLLAWVILRKECFHEEYNGDLPSLLKMPEDGGQVLIMNRLEVSGIVDMLREKVISSGFKRHTIISKTVFYRRLST